MSGIHSRLLSLHSFRGEPILRSSQLWQCANKRPVFSNRILFKFLFIDEREDGGGGERQRQGNINLLFHLSIHLLVDSFMYPD